MNLRRICCEVFSIRWPWFARYLKRSRRFIIEEDPTGEIVRPETWVPDLLKSAGAVAEIKQTRRLFRGRLRAVTGKAAQGV